MQNWSAIIVKPKTLGGGAICQYLFGSYSHHFLNVGPTSSLQMTFLTRLVRIHECKDVALVGVSIRCIDAVNRQLV